MLHMTLEVSLSSLLAPKMALNIGSNLGTGGMLARWKQIIAAADPDHLQCRKALT